MEMLQLRLSAIEKENVDGTVKVQEYVQDYQKTNCHLYLNSLCSFTAFLEPLVLLQLGKMIAT